MIYDHKQFDGRRKCDGKQEKSEWEPDKPRGTEREDVSGGEIRAE